MKTTTLPSLCVTSEQRRQQQAFIVRGLTNRAKARKASRYVTGETVLRKLRTCLEKARRTAAE